ncbi:hypothetical protein K501DRAFT_336282 [Backusella circina FSU 941]|nr:hypothetical protein K501DRAFT_336282 [Backusella circina FSU 941]
MIPFMRCVFFIYTILVSSVVSIDLPSINLDSIGQLGFIGDYAGLSPVKSEQQVESVTSGLILKDTNSGIYRLLGDVQGTIESSCALSEHTLILAGIFSTINNTEFNNIAQLDTQTRALLTLNQGLNGPVRSVYCDTANQTVYVGGDFTMPVGVDNTTENNFGGGHVAMWQNNQWSPVPWKGFNGPVYTITQNKATDSILFGGQFDSTSDGQYTNTNTSQSVDLTSSATISGGNGALTGNGTDPSSLVCSQAPWLLQDGVPGYWEADFNSPIQPSVFRISNAHSDDRGTDEFNIISLGSNDYFELSYIDPATNQLTTCTETCYLSNDSNISYQDFTVNNALSTQAIRININSWFGNGGGLGGVEIFHSDIALQPQPSSNTTSPCSTNQQTPSSTVTTTGNWTQVYSFEAYQNYMIASFPATDISTADVSVTYQPYIIAQGLYDVYVNTPGCIGTSTCNQRTQVELVVDLLSGNQSSMILDQQYTDDQRTLIYSGTVAATSDSFHPSITLHISPNATTPSSDTISIVASSIEFVRKVNGTTLSSILDYYPKNNTWIPLSEQLPLNSVVKTIQASADKLFIGGSFSSANSSYSNLVSFAYNQGLIPLTDSGVNGNISSSVLVGSNLYIAGQFNNTMTGTQPQLNHIGMYDITSNAWTALNQGINITVDKLFASNDDSIIHASGLFNTVNSTTSAIPAYNNAMWSRANMSWISPTSLVVGSITNMTQLDNNTSLYYGQIKSAQTYRANDVASFMNGNKDTLLSPITTIDPDAVINTGIFWKNASDNDAIVTILAGQFKLNDGKTYHLAIYSQDTWHGLFEGIQGDIQALAIANNQLFLGGYFNGSFQNTNVTSFAAYDLIRQSVVNINGVYDENKNPGRVNVIRAQPNGQYVYVGGQFAYAGFLNCGAICAFSLETRQWTQASQGVQGTINDIVIQNGKITVIGELTINQQQTNIAQLGGDNTPWSVPSSNPFPAFGTPTSLINYDEGSNQLMVAGSHGNGSFLGIWDGSQFSPISSGIGGGSTLNQLFLIPIDSSSPISARYPSGSDSMLMAVGHLELPNYGNASAALYDGATWYPFLLSSTSNGSSGHMSKIFTSSDCCSPTTIHHYLSVPAVILISIAISLGIIFCLAAIAFLYLFFKRKNSVHAYPEHMEQQQQQWKPRYTPAGLMTMLDSASQLDPALAAATASAAAGLKPPNDTGYSTAIDRRNNSVDLTDGSAPGYRYRNSSGVMASAAGISFSALMAGALANQQGEVASEENPHVYYAKYPFEAKEFGELSLDSGAAIVVTDTSDNVWWMGYKDDGSGNPVSGLFPSNYVSAKKPL